MKNRIKYLILWAFALVISMPKGMAQGFVEPTEHVREYHPSEGFTNVTLFKIIVFGNESHYSAEAIILQSSAIQIDPSTFKDKTSNVNVSVYQEDLNTSDSYNGDIIFDQFGNVVLNTNFRLYDKKFVQIFKITGDINTNNLKYGDRLDIKVIFGMGIDGVTPEYYYPEVQTLIYKGGIPSSVKETDLSAVNIFPNQFVNVINVDLPKEENVIITNTLGQTVYIGPSGPIETYLFPTGLYFIHTPYGTCKVVKYNN